MKYMKQILSLTLLTSAMATIAMQPLKVSELPIPEQKPVVASQEAQKGELFTAINAGNVDKVRTIIQANPALVNAENELGSALQQAALTGNLEVVKILIQAGANPNAGQNYGMTPLMWAINGGNKDVILYIVNLPNIDLNAKDNSGQSALDWVGFSGRLSDADRAEITTLLNDKGAQ